MAKNEEFKQLIRIGDRDLDGNKGTYFALTKIKGVSYSFANALCNTFDIKKTEKIGNLSDEQIQKIGDAIRHPEKYNLKSWLFNRQKDLDSGQDKHLISSDLKLRKDFDIKRLRMIKSYRGFRHGFGLPLRGQRTKSNFRKGTTVGVKKKGAKGKKG